MGAENEFSADGIDVQTKRKVQPEFACAAVFYLIVLVQIIMSFIIFGSKNSEMPFLTNNGLECTAPYKPAFGCTRAGPGQLVGIHFCVTQDLCDEVKACTSGASTRRLLSAVDDNATSFHEEMSSGEFYRRLAAETGPAPQARLLERELAVRRLQNSNAKAVDGLWDFLESHVYQPITLLACAVVLGALWLILLAKCAKVAVWGSIIFDIIALIGVFIWYLVDFDAQNWACLVLAGVMAIGAVIMRKQINTCAYIMETAMKGLGANKRIFLVSAGMQVVWLAYFSIFIAAIIGMHFVKEVRKESMASSGNNWNFQPSSYHTCELVNKGWVSNSGIVFVYTVCYYWVTCFINNIILMLITANLTGWYFQQDGFKSFWVKALPWTVFQQGGGNAIASAIMGVTQYLLDRVGNKWKMIFSLLGPWNWILVCVGFCLQAVIEAYTQFALIAMTYSGMGFCQAASGSLKLLKDRMGTVVLTNFLGKDVMGWACYMISLSVGFAAWAWAEDLQGVTSSFAGMDAAALTISVIAFAYFLAYPFITLILVILAEPWVSSNICSVAGGSDCWEIMARITSILCALFLGCLTMFVLQAVSHIVVSSMNVIFFCFALEDSVGKKQERFDQLYSSIKATVVTGTVVQAAGGAGQNGVVAGTAVGGDPVQPPAQPAQQSNVVGTPVNNEVQV